MPKKINPTIILHNEAAERADASASRASVSEVSNQDAIAQPIIPETDADRQARLEAFKEDQRAKNDAKLEKRFERKEQVRGAWTATRAFAGGLITSANVHRKIIVESAKEKLGRHKKFAIAVAGVAVVGSLVGIGYVWGNSNNHEDPFAGEKSKATAAVSANTAENQTTSPDVQEIGVAGQHPCGPGIDTVEAKKRIANGETVVKVSETADFLDKNPAREQAFNNFYNALGTNDKAAINWIISNTPVLNEKIRTGHEGSLIRELKSRLEDKTLTANTVFENHECHDMKIVSIGDRTFVVGDQVWVKTLSQTEYDAMPKSDRLVIFSEDRQIAGKDGVMTAEKVYNIVFEAGVCNNPLLKPESHSKAMIISVPLKPVTPKTPETPSKKLYPAVQGTVNSSMGSGGQAGPQGTVKSNTLQGGSTSTEKYPTPGNSGTGTAEDPKTGSVPEDTTQKPAETAPSQPTNPNGGQPINRDGV